MLIRRFQAQDTEQIARLFHDTIRTVNLGDYTQEQVEAWAPDDLHFRNWLEICSNRCTFVADEAGEILGYGQLEGNGHIHHFYVHHAHQRQGVARAIYAAIESEARRLGLTRLFTEASITARGFFERVGFQLLHEQTVTCRGRSFINFAMHKHL